MRSLLASLILLMGSSASAFATEAKGVVTSIAPVHSLVQSVMGDTGTADLLLKGVGSPHHFQLKPSHIKQINNAAVVFYVGDGIEAFLKRARKASNQSEKFVSLIEQTGILVRGVREGGAWEAHDHGDHEGHGHDDHGHGDKHAKEHDDHKHGEKHEHDHDDHKHEEKHGHDHDDHKYEEKHDHDHDKHAGHDDHHNHELEDDHHIWLDPANAKAIVRAAEKHLATAFPKNASIYARNAAAVTKKLDMLDAELRQSLAALQNKNYVVFHDAYQYFEARYELGSVGSVLVSPSQKPSVQRIREIQAKLKATKAKCLFREPQFSKRVSITIVDGTDVNLGTLDPIGASIAPGADMYFTLMRNLSAQLSDCLTN